MKFRTEEELVGTLTTALKHNYARSCVQIYQEVSLGFGIADLVLSDVIGGKCNMKKNDIELNFKDINTYNLVWKNEKISVDEIISITRCSKQEVLFSLKKLQAKKHVKFEDSYVYRNENYSLSFKSSFAIEAKLKDWKRALKQAYRYRWFAEYSYVVLDSFYSKTALKNIDDFKKYNVGLATINPEGILIRHFSPKREKPFDEKMQILLSEKIKNHQLFIK